MPKRHRRRTMKGGFLEDFSNSVSNWSDSFYNGMSNFWNKSKNAASCLTGSSSSAGYVPASTTNYMSSPTYGGRTRRRHMKGGYSANSPTTGIATTAAPFSGVTAQPQTWVGGKTRKRRGRKHRHSRSCKHRR